MQRQPAVLVQGLEKTYPGGTRAIDGIDFTVDQGEFFGFLGPNGAGKTTTIKIWPRCCPRAPAASRLPASTSTRTRGPFGRPSASGLKAARWASSPSSQPPRSWGSPWAAWVDLPSGSPIVAVRTIIIDGWVWEHIVPGFWVLLATSAVLIILRIPPRTN